MNYRDAFIDMYEAIDGVSDEMSKRDWELSNRFWALYLEACEERDNE